jgi:Heavy metal binding domain
MKPKLILIIILAVTLGVAAGWLAPHQLGSTNAAAGDPKILYYACPMHPTIKYDHPGDCPICGMKLQPVYADETKTNAPTATP